ncbi:hypothetical protein DFJ74DRAFT_658172 [Hyaloraphidium curvatum]|nr:hypothetical protein DFJ74DRAFT_658172 [Hyaloraphidium curvatum]
MASLAPRHAVRPTVPFVDKENVLATKAGATGAKRLAKSGNALKPETGKGDVASGRAPLKAHGPPNVPAIRDRVAGKPSAVDPKGKLVPKEVVKQRQQSPTKGGGKVAPLAQRPVVSTTNNGRVGQPKSPALNSTSGRRFMPTRTPGTAKKAFLPLHDTATADLAAAQGSLAPKQLSKDFVSPDVTRLQAHPVSRDSNPLQNRPDSGAKRLRKRASLEQAQNPVAETVATPTEDEEDVEIEYCPPKREYDELQDIPPLPEIDLEGLKYALRQQMPIIVDPAAYKLCRVTDPFACPEDPEADNWDYFTRPSSDDGLQDLLQNVLDLQDSLEIPPPCHDLFDFSTLFPVE